MRKIAEVGFAEKLISFEEARRLFDYDPRTGLITWKAKAGKASKMKVGDIAGCVTCDGYITIKINYYRYSAHRLAWLLTRGRWPEREIDHINLIKSDNRVENLREATTAQNAHNRNNTKVNKTGYAGVRYLKRTNVFTAEHTTNTLRQHLGTFDTAEAASRAYRTAIARARGDFALATSSLKH